MKIVVNYLNFAFHIVVKTKFSDKFLNFVFQFIKNTKWYFGYTGCNTICREFIEQDQPHENLKSKRKSVIILGEYDQTHKRVGNSEKTKTRMQSFCENLPRSNYSMYG